MSIRRSGNSKKIRISSDVDKSSRSGAIKGAHSQILSQDQRIKRKFNDGYNPLEELLERRERAERLHDMRRHIARPDDGDPGYVDDDDADMAMLEDGDVLRIQAVIEGRERVEMSNLGGEVWEVYENLYCQLRTFKRIDRRTRRDRTERRNIGFEPLYDQMAHAYMEWAYERVDGGAVSFPEVEIVDKSCIHVLDVFHSFYTIGSQFETFTLAPIEFV
ncbi:hypothetical protein BDZ89DRAFT_1139745 [Hymenopellis radicata]|nr:hypothetical protein BDZ89DRAFT_1139745 [Hymenopellis radicata]